MEASGIIISVFTMVGMLVLTMARTAIHEQTNEKDVVTNANGSESGPEE